MANRTVQFIIDLKDQLSGKLRRVDTALDRTGKRGKRSFAEIATAARTATAAVGVFGGAIAGVGLTRFAKAALDAGRETENLRTALVSVTGSAKEANDLIAQTEGLASTVAASFKDLSRAAAGFRASIAGSNEEAVVLAALAADISAFSGGMVTVAEASDQLRRGLAAGAASMDLFRDRSVSSLLQIEAGAEMTAAQTREHFLKLATDAEFGLTGAAVAAASTFDGLVSMVGDKTEKILRTIGEQLLPGVKEELSVFDQILGEITTNGADDFASLGDAIGSLVPGAKGVTVAVLQIAKAAISVKAALGNAADFAKITVASLVGAAESTTNAVLAATDAGQRAFIEAIGEAKALGAVSIDFLTSALEDGLNAMLESVRRSVEAVARQIERIPGLGNVGAGLRGSLPVELGIATNFNAGAIRAETQAAIDAVGRDRVDFGASAASEEIASSILARNEATARQIGSIDDLIELTRELEAEETKMLDRQALIEERSNALASALSGGDDSIASAAQETSAALTELDATTERTGTAVASVANQIGASFAQLGGGLARSLTDFEQYEQGMGESLARLTQNFLETLASKLLLTGVGAGLGALAGGVIFPGVGAAPGALAGAGILGGFSIPTNQSAGGGAPAPDAAPAALGRGPVPPVVVIDQSTRIERIDATDVASFRKQLAREKRFIGDIGEERLTQPSARRRVGLS